MTNNANHCLAELLSQPGFDEIARLSKNRHWFTYLPRLWYEQQRQACLLWLLTPSEGHDQGDYFIKRLLSAAFAQAEETNTQIPISGSPESRLALLNKSYGSAVAAQEVQFQEGADSYRYIDLLVVDPDNRIVILIERKDGTSEQNDQLTSYLDYVKGYCDSSYSIFPILMDSYNADHNASAKGYVQLDDRWLIEAIDELLNHNELEPSIRWNLSTLCNYVFSEYWDGNREPYYQGTNDKFNQFAGENAKLLRNLFQVPCKHEGTGDSSVTVGEADYQDLLWTLMSQSDVAQGLEPASIHCHARYYDTLWELSEYSGLTPIAEKITSHWDDMYAHVYFYGNAPILEATCKYGWEQRGGYSPEGDIYWPFYIIVAAKD